MLDNSPHSIGDSNKMILNDIIINTPKIKLMPNEEFVSKLTSFCMHKANIISQNDSAKGVSYRELLDYGINLRKENIAEEEVVRCTRGKKISNKKLKELSSFKHPACPLIRRQYRNNNRPSIESEDGQYDTATCLKEKRMLFTKTINFQLLNSLNSRLIYVFKNVYDSFESENEEIEYEYLDYLPRFYSIAPHSVQESAYQVILEILHFVHVVYYSTSLISEINVRTLELTLEICLVLKLLITYLIIGFTDTIIGKINFNPIKILIFRVTSNPFIFVFNLLNAIPIKLFNFLLRVSADWKINYTYVFLKIMLILTMSKYLNISSLFNSLHSEERRNNSSKLLKRGFSAVQQFFGRPEFKILALFLLSLHLYSCVWIFCAKKGLNIPFFKEESWIVFYSFCDLELSRLYIISLYFSMTTLFTVGYGDVVANSTIERVVVIILLVVGCFIYTFFISITSNLMAKQNQKLQMLTERMDFLKSIKEKYSLTPKFSRKVEDQIKFFIKNWHGDKEDLLKSLPNSLKAALQTTIYSKYFSKVNFLQSVKNHSFLVTLSSKVKIYNYLKQEVILQQSQILDEMLFVISGSILLLTKIGYENCPIAKINEGNHFGSILIYTLSLSPFTLISEKKSTIMTLSKKDLSALKQEYTSIVGGLLKESYISHLFTEIKRKMGEQYFTEYYTLMNFEAYYMNKVNESLMKDMDGVDLEPHSILNEISKQDSQKAQIKDDKIASRKKQVKAKKIFSKQRTVNFKCNKSYLEDNFNLNFSFPRSDFDINNYSSNEAQQSFTVSDEDKPSSMIGNPSNVFRIRAMLNEIRGSPNFVELKLVKKHPIPKSTAKINVARISATTQWKICTQYSFSISKSPSHGLRYKNSILIFDSSVNALNVPRVKGQYKTSFLKQIDKLISNSVENVTSPYMENQIQSLVKKRRRKRNLTPGILNLNIQYA